MTDVLAEYERLVAAGEVRADPAQARVAARLAALQTALQRSPPPRSLAGRVRRWLGRSTAPVQGIYLWGDVGRGKTFLMDLLYAQLPGSAKLRQHFHRFMAGVHASLKRHRNVRDPLEHVADELAARCRILCFDEFAVTDIADAMILGNLLEGLFARGVTLAATSNTPPQRLYEGGLQRARFLPAIASIERHTDVVHIDGQLDYRLEFLERTDLYQHPADAQATARLAAYFDAVAPHAEADPGSLDVLGRSIEFVRCADGIVWFDFAQICDGPRSQDDYIELSRCYQSVIVSNVPRFTRELENQARRFIALVDEFYDRRVKLIVSAAVPAESLYAGKRLTREFARTRSRLEEMQSTEYLHAAHRT
jgi:cell division protein ZapE